MNSWTLESCWDNYDLTHICWNISLYNLSDILGSVRKDRRTEEKPNIHFKRKPNIFWTKLSCVLQIQSFGYGQILGVCCKKGLWNSQDWENRKILCRLYQPDWMQICYQTQAHKRIALFTEEGFKMFQKRCMKICMNALWQKFTFCFCVVKNVMLDNVYNHI